MKLETDIIRIKETSSKGTIKVYIKRREYLTRHINDTGYDPDPSKYEEYPFKWFEFSRFKLKRIFIEDERENNGMSNTNWIYKADGYKIWTIFSGIVLGSFFCGLFVGKYLNDRESIKIEYKYDLLRDSLRLIPFVNHALLIPNNKTTSTTK